MIIMILSVVNPLTFNFEPLNVTLKSTEEQEQRIALEKQQESAKDEERFICTEIKIFPSFIS